MILIPFITILLVCGSYCEDASPPLLNSTAELDLNQTQPAEEESSKVLNASAAVTATSSFNETSASTTQSMSKVECIARNVTDDVVSALFVVQFNSVFIH